MAERKMTECRAAEWGMAERRIDQRQANLPGRWSNAAVAFKNQEPSSEERPREKWPSVEQPSEEWPSEEWPREELPSVERPSEEWPSEEWSRNEQTYLYIASNAVAAFKDQDPLRKELPNVGQSSEDGCPSVEWLSVELPSEKWTIDEQTYLDAASNATVAFENQEPSSEERPNVERSSKAIGSKGRSVEGSSVGSVVRSSGRRVVYGVSWIEWSKFQEVECWEWRVSEYVGMPDLGFFWREDDDVMIHITTDLVAAGGTITHSHLQPPDQWWCESSYRHLPSKRSLGLVFQHTRLLSIPSTWPFSEIPTTRLFDTLCARLFDHSTLWHFIH